MISISGFAAFEPKGLLREHLVARADLTPHEVLMKVTHCGVCQSDVHLIDNDWGYSPFPLVAGHEVVGVVERVGSAVTHLQAGDRCAVGWQCSSCHHCPMCLRGLQHKCDFERATPVGVGGGFADRIVVDGTFAFPVPVALSSRDAAPLLCAGVTVFAPLHEFCDCTSRVGVVGLGGLGHLAVQFASKMGCHVTVFTTNTGKVEEARRMGAHRVIVSGDVTAMHAASSSIDVLLCTVDSEISVPAYMKCLAKRGKFVILGSPGKIELDAGQVASFFIMENKCLIGRNIGSPSCIQDMLQFAARNKIKPIVEPFPISQINEAIQHTRSGKARYRVVLEFP